MTNYLREYTKHIDKLINTNNVTEEDIKNHLVKIEFFQHERFIHLMVTLFFALFDVLFIGLSFLCPYFVLVIIFLTIFLICYVVHYYHLENGVQYLYKQYDKMKEIKKNKKNYLQISKNFL